VADSGGHGQPGGAGSGGASGQGAGPIAGDGGAIAVGGAGATSGLDPLPTDWDGSPIYARAVRLTNSQWSHAVTDILRLSAPTKLADGFELPVAGTTDFTNNERLLVVNPRQFGDFELAAEAAAAQATESASALAALSPDTTPEGFVRLFGKRAFRRPLTHDEELKYQQVYAQGESLYGAGFANGASLVIRAMLQSPQFLYRSELGPVGEPLNAYEVSAKLSFWLLDTTPSDALLDAAGAGKLDSVDALVDTAKQMLEDPRARDVMRDFHAQLYHLERLRSAAKSDSPEYSDALGPELVESSYRFFDDVFTEGHGLREIFTSNRAFVGPLAAPLYGITPAPSSIEARVVGPARIGYFMQVPFSFLYAFNRDPDSILRGVALQRDVLCATIASPPLIPSVPAAAAGQTNRQRISALTDSCGAGCHREYINPLGFAFENFDGIGQERQTDHGLPVDTSGRYPFAEGMKGFADAKELMAILASSTQAQSCYARKMTGYALQRDVVERDSSLVETLAKINRSQSIKELVIALVKAPAFREREGGNP